MICLNCVNLILAPILEENAELQPEEQEHRLAVRNQTETQFQLPSE